MKSHMLQNLKGFELKFQSISDKQGIVVHAYNSNTLEDEDKS
jgi:hypothetical protein